MQKRHVFFISDSTGITAKTLGNSILSQFTEIQFVQTVIPYVDTPVKAEEAVRKINTSFEATGELPIVFDTVINVQLNQILSRVKARRFDILGTYLEPLSQEFGCKPSKNVGRAHGNTDDQRYKDRINAIHFAMDNDDGGKTRYFDQADIILIGASRCGKTPTCLYLGLQFGLFAANYPLTEDDLEVDHLPAVLQPYKDRLFGLSIDPERLSVIRNERQPGSRYASIRQCEHEIREIEALFRSCGIDYVDTTDLSIEEIATKIIDNFHHKRGIGKVR